MHRTLADWSPASDTLARVQMLNVCGFVHDRACVAGQHNNLICRVDLLAALGIAHESELFPTPDAFLAAGPTIERPVADDVITKIKTAGRPLLLHSVGGMGKTIVIQAIAHHLEARHPSPGRS